MMRLSQKNRIGFLLTMLCIIADCAFAQKTFKYQASLHKVYSSGFYNITLLPDLIAKSKADLSDIRIIDQKGNYVPYIKSTIGPQEGMIKFHAFPQIQDKTHKDTGTTFIAEIDKKQLINILYVRLRNTEVKRFVNIFGSDDLKQWYAIKENIPLQGDFLNTDGTYMQSLSFPASSYHYLKLLVNDRNKAPVKFLQAGIYIHLQIKDSILRISHNDIIKKDSDQKTSIIINFKDFYRTDLLHFEISGPKYYRRTVMIYDYDNKIRHLIGSDEISSNKKNDVLITFKANKLELQILNGDNPPLSIKDILTFQQNHSITSYLEKDKAYFLLTGDTKALAPDYDLNSFADSIRDLVPEITHMQVVKNTVLEVPKAKTQSQDYTIEIWIAVIFALILLSLLTLKMTKEVNKKIKNG